MRRVALALTLTPRRMRPASKVVNIHGQHACEEPLWVFIYFCVMFCILNLRGVAVFLFP